jgi:phosphate transport system protein
MFVPTRHRTIGRAEGENNMTTPGKARPSLDRDLVALRDNVIRLSQLVALAIEQAMQALRELNSELGRQVMAADSEVNRLRYQIEDDSYRLLALRQPTARDMRTVMAATHIAIELERIGDHAAGIAKLATQLAQYPALRPSPELIRMSTIASDMLGESMDAYVNWNIEKALLVKKRDNDIDRLNDQVYHDLLSCMLKEPGTINRGTYMLWISHGLERIGDRVTNICERVVYMVTGQVRAKFQQKLPLQNGDSGVSEDEDD